jgi:hypothetical protein
MSLDPAYQGEIPEDQAALEADIRVFATTFDEFRVKPGRSSPSPFKQDLLPQVLSHFHELCEIAKIGLS